MEIIKLKIDLHAKIFEFEGSADFAREALAEFLKVTPKTAMASVDVDPESIGSEICSESTSRLPDESGPKEKKSPRKSNRSPKESHSIPKDLDLSGKTADIVSLITFFSEKNPSNAQEKNVVFVYYLSKMLKIPTVTVDHVYACYKEVKSKVPAALRQTLFNTSKRQAWIDTANMDSLRVQVRGENFVEHDLPKEARPAK